VRARALHNGDWVVFRLEWDDATQDLIPHPGKSADAAAIQFPLTQTADVPSPAMGERGKGVRIWYWKSVWQDDEERKRAGKGDRIATLYPNAAPDHYPYQANPAAREEMEKRYAPARAAGNPVLVHPNAGPAADSALVDSGRSAHFDRLAYADWLKRLRQVCSECGIVLIFDEVFVGFRLAPGGAQEYFGVRADLTTYAKSIANGFPLAAIAGTEDVMSVVGPGSVAHGGTYTGNMPGTAAADATLEILEKQDIIGSIAERGQKLQAGIDRILSDAGIAHALMGPPQMFGCVLGVDAPPRDYREALNSDHALYEHIMSELIERVVMAEMDFREPWFLCYEHSQADIDETLNAFADAVRVVKKR